MTTLAYPDPLTPPRAPLGIGFAASVILHAAALALVPFALDRVINPPRPLPLTVALRVAPPPMVEPPPRVEPPPPPPPPKPAPRVERAATPPVPAPPLAPVPAPVVETPPAPTAIEARREPPPVEAPPVALKAPAVEAPAPRVESPRQDAAKRTPAVADPAPYSPPLAHASYLKNPKPEYPRNAYRRREEGVVTLLVRVSVEGKPIAVSVFKSSGFRTLDDSAREVVASSFRFVPARRGDKAEEGEVLVPIEYVLPRD